MLLLNLSFFLSLVCSTVQCLYLHIVTFLDKLTRVGFYYTERFNCSSYFSLAWQILITLREEASSVLKRSRQANVVICAPRIDKCFNSLKVISPLLIRVLPSTAFKIGHIPSKEDCTGGSCSGNGKPNTFMTIH